MDKLGKQFYSHPNLLYKYKSEVLVPPLQMVDDVLCASKCGSQVVTNNAAITTFARLKKLDLNETKCARIHIAKNKCDQCAKIFVNGRVFRESQKEKYLGDYLTQYANPNRPCRIEKKEDMEYCRI
jgi:hypothetical protein